MSTRRALPDALPADERIVDSRYLTLEPAPRLVRTARDFVRDSLPPLPEDVLDVVLLLTSELVTNAVIHARTTLEVGVLVSERSVVVTVHDLDLSRPEQHPYTDREGGWGLALVGALAEDHAVAPAAEGGKTAWFRVAQGAGADVADDAAARAVPVSDDPAPTAATAAGTTHGRSSA
jgi:anti-sigma regulatory factor (Ser/Thr protein kinase)